MPILRRVERYVVMVGLDLQVKTPRRIRDLEYCSHMGHLGRNVSMISNCSCSSICWACSLCMRRNIVLCSYEFGTETYCPSDAMIN